MSRTAAAALFSILAPFATTAAGADAPAAPAGWSFAVSGDSRDCGDLVMPKIARAIAQEPAPGVDFYWHLGDFRRMYDVDCDILVRTHPGYDCSARPAEPLGDGEMAAYEEGAWADFVDRQLKPFGALPVFLGLGNHELYGRTREDFSRTFRPWLSQKALHLQRIADGKKGISSPGPTSYHFVHRGVHFIYLDNADESSFTAAQLVWLSRVLADHAGDDSVRTIVLGIHEALPFSTARIHAMDASCQGICSGQQAYDIVFRAQNLSGPKEKQKRAYVVASHAHAYLTDVYDTPEHRGQVLTGWIVGTAGAIQSSDAIRYGYLRMTVAPDGTVTPEFREVTRTSLPFAAGPGGESLTDFCFTANKRKQVDDSHKGDCACGALP